MIHARILTTRGTTFDLDVLEVNEPDQLGAARIVPGNTPGTVKAIICGQAEFEAERGATLGPMHNGDTITSTDPRFLATIETVLGVRHGAVAHAVVALHDRYETPAQYALLSA
jgi:hypothetical protein